jgi:hypothetical protein
MLLEDIPAPEREFGYLQITQSLMSVLSEPRLHVMRPAASPERFPRLA